MKEIPFHVTRQRERTKKKGTKNRRKGRKQPGGTRRKLFLASNKIQIHKKKKALQLVIRFFQSLQLAVKSLLHSMTTRILQHYKIAFHTSNDIPSFRLIILKSNRAFPYRYHIYKKEKILKVEKKIIPSINIFLYYSPSIKIQKKKNNVEQQLSTFQ